MTTFGTLNNVDTSVVRCVTWILFVTEKTFTFVSYAVSWGVTVVNLIITNLSSGIRANSLAFVNILTVTIWMNNSVVWTRTSPSSTLQIGANFIDVGGWRITVNCRVTIVCFIVTLVDVSTNNISIGHSLNVDVFVELITVTKMTTNGNKVLCSRKTGMGS